MRLTANGHAGVSSSLALASLIQRSPVVKKERKAGARPNGERERRSWAPVIAIFVMHIRAYVKLVDKRFCKPS